MQQVRAGLQVAGCPTQQGLAREPPWGPPWQLPGGHAVRLFQAARFERARLRQQGSRAQTQKMLRGRKPGPISEQILGLSGVQPMARPLVWLLLQLLAWPMVRLLVQLLQLKSRPPSPPGDGAQRLGVNPG